MREIKFRSWDVERRKMMGVHCLAFHERYGYEMISIEKTKNDNNLTSVFVKPEEFELMQYTGLKDKNGVKIFQDDVVSICWSDEIGEAHWNKITIKNPFDYSVEEARYLIHADELEILGNVHENPELLNG